MAQPTPPQIDPLAVLRAVIFTVDRSLAYRSSDRTVYRAVTQARPAEMPVSPEVRFEGLPGEFAQFDFGQCLVRFRDGSTAKVRFFAGILK